MGYEQSILALSLAKCLQKNICLLHFIDVVSKTKGNGATEQYTDSDYSHNLDFILPSKTCTL